MAKWELYCSFSIIARYTGRVLYEDFAGEMLEEVIQELHSDLPIRFSDGLCGIAWGLVVPDSECFIVRDCR